MSTGEGVRREGTGRWLGAALALVLAAPAAGVAGEAGYRITPSGYRVPVLGSFLAEDGSGPVCRRLDADEIAASDLDRLVRARSQASLPRATVHAAATGVEFVIVYTDPAGTGFDDPALGEARRAAMVASLGAWSRVLVGTVPITVEARFSASDSPDTLASAAPTDFVVQDGLLVPFALASQRALTPANPGGADLAIEFGQQVQWDYVPDGVAAEGMVSFVYTAIHEIGHGLGFLDSFDPETGALSNALPTPYDVHVNRGTAPGNLLLSHGAEQLKEDLISADLYFAGANAVQASLASITPLPMLRLFAPNPYQQGSSVSHLDQETYANVLTGLMVPADYGPDYAYVDSLALAIMADLGYVTDPAAIPAAPGQ
jgi:hypothetical protein